MEESIKNFITESIKQIEEGLPKGFEINETIKFDVMVTHTLNKEGKLDIKLVSGKAANEHITTQRITFAVVNPSKQKAAFDAQAETFIHYMQIGLGSLAALGAQKDDDKPKKRDKQKKETKGKK